MAAAVSCDGKLHWMRHCLGDEEEEEGEGGREGGREGVSEGGEEGEEGGKEGEKSDKRGSSNKGNRLIQDVFHEFTILSVFLLFSQLPFG